MRPAVYTAAVHSDVRPVDNPALDRFASAVVTAVPPALLVLAIVFGWGSLLHWEDLVVFTVTYLLVGFGVTVGFHRLLTHGSFKTHRWVRLTAAALGSAAVEGPVIEWVADSPQAPSLLRRGGRPAQSPRRPRLGLPRGA